MLNGEDINRLPEDIMDQIYFHRQGCWEWVGNKVAYGMPAIRFEKRTYISARKYIYQLLVAKVEGGLNCHNTCRNINCVNPRHVVLYKGTKLLNLFCGVCGDEKIKTGRKGREVLYCKRCTLDRNKKYRMRK